MMLRAKEAEGLSAAAVKQIHAILRAALQHAMWEDLVARNVEARSRDQRPSG